MFMCTGVLIRKMVTDIQEHRAGKLIRDRKAFLFGVHEFNIASLGYALGTNEPTIPAYGATIIFETLRDKKGIYYIRVCDMVFRVRNKSRNCSERDLQNNRFFVKSNRWQVYSP